VADLVLFDLDGVLVDSERLAARLESELVTALAWHLSEAGVPYGVASSSRHEQIALKLRVTGLESRFVGSVFSCDDVAAPKPAPDVFLHAARTRGVDPARCVVVEDSPTGCRAGLAAGMRVLGLVTPFMDPAPLSDLGVELVQGLGEIPIRLGLAGPLTPPV
jgi:beta-phosphoglucomutase-like phosphatase (HAD superfamily)